MPPSKADIASKSSPGASSTTPVSARVTQDTEVLLSALALVEGTSVGTVVREALDYYFTHRWPREALLQALDEHYERERSQEEAVKQATLQSFHRLVTAAADD